jgi:hypothetical protein
MGSGASRPPPSNYQLTDDEVDTIYAKVTSSIGEQPDSNGLSQEDMLVQVVERKYGLQKGSFENLINSGRESPRPPGDLSGDTAPPAAAAEGAAAAEEGGTASVQASEDRATDMPDMERSHTLIRADLSSLELAAAMRKTGVIKGDDAATNEMITALFGEIQSIMQGKPHTLVPTEEVPAINWKALEMMGDENLITEQKERGVVDVTHDAKGGGSKALKMVGEVKAIGNKKMRDRLGSDMSHDQMKRQQMMEAAEKKKKESHGGSMGSMLGLG